MSKNNLKHVLISEVNNNAIESWLMIIYIYPFLGVGNMFVHKDVHSKRKTGEDVIQNCRQLVCLVGICDYDLTSCDNLSHWGPRH